MITSVVLLNTPLTARTFLRRLRNQPLTRYFLYLLQSFIRAVVVLVACLARVPCHAVICTMCLPTVYATELCSVHIGNMPRFAVLGNAPGKSGDGFEGGAGAEFVISFLYISTQRGALSKEYNFNLPAEYLARRELLHVFMLQAQ